MAREVSLLDRLRHPEDEDRRSLDPDAARLERSVLASLERLLNTRHGSAPTRLDYGIPSIEDMRHGGADLLREMSEAIQLSIREFEPRLQNVRVRMVPRTAESTQLRFDITAEMVAGPNKSKVRFETKLENSGRLSLKE